MTIETIISSIHTDKYQQDELRIKKALLYIERNYGSAVMLEEIAASASVSTSTCLRLFSAIVGTTPVNYLMNCRLQKAARRMNLSQPPLSYHMKMLDCTLLRSPIRLDGLEARLLRKEPFIAVGNSDDFRVGRTITIRDIWHRTVTESSLETEILFVCRKNERPNSSIVQLIGLLEKTIQDSQ